MAKKTVASVRMRALHDEGADVVALPNPKNAPIHDVVGAQYRKANRLAQVFYLGRRWARADLAGGEMFRVYPCDEHYGHVEILVLDEAS